MIFGKLLPREGNFFELFNQHANHIVAAANAFAELVKNYSDPALREKYNQQVDDAEGAADSVTIEVNRLLHKTFRKDAVAWASKHVRGRPYFTPPRGPEEIVYGDKVINVLNQERFDVWPAVDGEAYIANGDLGMVVGQYKGQNAKFKGLPKKLEVEFAGQLGHKYGFWPSEFGDDASKRTCLWLKNLPPLLWLRAQPIPNCMRRHSIN